MRIVSWNCAMGFSKKRHLIEALKPDVAILPETSERHIKETEARFKAWVGTNPHKGLGVVGFTDRSYMLHEAPPAVALAYPIHSGWSEHNRAVGARPG